MVGPGEVGVKLRFGRVIMGPPAGLHFRLAWPFESHRLIVRTLVRRHEFGMPRAPRGRKLRARNAGPACIWVELGAENSTAGVWTAKETAPEDQALLTGDNNLIDLRSGVQYQVKSGLAYAYNLAEPDALVRTTILAALRGVIETRAIDAIYTAARDESNAPPAIPPKEFWTVTRPE